MNTSGRTLASVLAILGSVKILEPNVLGQMFAMDNGIALLAISVAVIAYGVWYGPLRFLSGSSVTRFFGLTILFAGVVSIVSPTLLGIRATYVPIADVFMLIESGIVLQLIGLQRKEPETLSPLLFMSLVGQLLLRRASHSRLPASSTVPSTSH